MIVRVTDTGGNVVDRGPYPVSRSRPPIAARSTAPTRPRPASSSVIWTAGGGQRGRSATAARRACAAVSSTPRARPSAARNVQLLTRDLRRDAAWSRARRSPPTPTARFRTTVTASASRLLHFRWVSRANDVRFGANGYLTLQARASGRLSVSTRRPRVGRTVHDHGQAARRLARRRPDVVQGRAGGSRRYATFADTDDVFERPLPRPLPLPQRRLARALVRVPRAHPPRPALPVRDGLLQDRDRRVRCPGSRLPPVYGHGRRER